MGSKIDKLLDWQTHAVVEAAITSENTGENIKAHVTQELIDKHKTRAKASLKSALLECVPEGATRDEILENIERLFGGEG